MSAPVLLCKPCDEGRHDDCPLREFDPNTGYFDTALGLIPTCECNCMEEPADSIEGTD